MKNPMSFSYLQQSEAETMHRFTEALPSIQSGIPNLLDTLFRLAYFAKQQEAAGATDAFPYFVFERYVRLPYTVRATWIPVGTGYYAEGSVLVRLLLETFVQLRYFTTRREQLITHLNKKGQKGKVQFKTMFDEFAPDYYDGHYRVLASIAHGGYGFSVLSGLSETTEGTRRTPAGCEFDENRCSYVVNQILMLISGYLTNVPEWFTQYQQLVPPEAETERLQTLETLKKWRTGHRATFPHSHGWVDSSDLLMGHAEGSKA
jgi:hypothetical protein